MAIVYRVPPNSRAPGTVDPAGDMNDASNMLGLLAALVAQQYGYSGHAAIPTDNATNVSNLVTRLGSPAPPAGVSAWINVTQGQYAADRTGVVAADATINQAFQDAYALWPGCTVYIPWGIYATNAPVLMPPGARLVCDGSNEVSTYRDFLLGTVIRPTAAFSSGTNPWKGVISIIGQTPGGYARRSEEQKLTGFSLDCHLVGGTTVNGIHLYGDVARVHMSDICVSDAPHDGVSLDTDGSGNQPGATRMNRVNVRYAGHHGYYIYRVSDLSAYDCLALNAVADGWNVTNLSNGMIQNCRSEHSGNNGLTFNCTNSGTGSGTAKLNCFSTDRNEHHGVEIYSSNGSGIPVQLTGCQIRRDGANGNTGGGNYAGLYIHDYPGPVLLDGTAVWPGVDDAGAGTNSPQNGMRIAALGTNATVQVAGCYLQGQTAAYITDASGTLMWDDATVAATGPTSAPVKRGPRMGTGTLAAGTATIASTAVNADSAIFVTPTSLGSGSTGRMQVTTKTAGTSFVVTSTSGSDTSTFSWIIKNP